MTQYTLPQIVTMVGTFTVDLFSEFAGLTIPTNQSFLEVGELEEVADITMGVIQASKLTVKMSDDYSAYSYGFWFKVLSGDCRIRFYLNQGSGDTFYFFGKPQAETLTWDEHYIGGSTRIRTVTVDLTSVALNLYSTPTTTWIDEVLTRSTNTGYNSANEPSWLIQVAGLFASMLTASGLNPSYDINNVIYVWSSGPDFKWMKDAGENNFSNLWVPTKYYSGVADFPTLHFAHGAGSLEAYYPKLQVLLGDLLRNFGVIMRMDYLAGSHIIYLIQRGRAYSATLDLINREKQSSIARSFQLAGDAVKCQDVTDGTKSCWFSKKYSDAPTISTPPNYVAFDIETQSIFRVNASAVQGSANRSVYTWDQGFGDAPVAMNGIKYYNYSTGAFVAASAASLLAEEAIAGYIYGRFTSQYSQVTRRYGGFRANDGTVNDHTRFSILRRATIDDGLNPGIYYANRVRKYAMSSEVEVEWIKE